jgi:uncharacterized protein YunC (DUF1805 family)
MAKHDLLGIPWGMRLVVLGVLLAVAGCSDPYGKKLPSGNLQDWKPSEDLRAAIAKIPSVDADLLKGYLVRHAMASTFGGVGIPDGTTIRAAIDEQKSWLSQNAARGAEATALATKMRVEHEAKSKILIDTITVAVTGFRLDKNEFGSGYFRIRVAFRNKTDKPIAGVKGVLHLADMFDDALKDVTISFDQGINAGESAETSFELRYNPYIDEDKKLAAADPLKLHMLWEPGLIVFEDGTRLTAE